MTIQVELINSLVIMTILAVAFIIIGRKFKNADPIAKPKGIVLVVETGIQMMYNYMSSIMPGPGRFKRNYYPYFCMLFVYVFICNISGLLGIEAPTSCLSITLPLGLTTIFLIQFNSCRTNGAKAYIKNLLIPPTNILGAISPMISLSMRLFGNILAGSILMSLIYSFTGYLSSFIIDFNFLGPVIAPVLHMYFDLFAGFVQTLIFVTLSSILISLEVN